MTTNTTNKLKKILAMVLAFAMVMGTVPITAMAADGIEVTFVSGQSSGLPLGGYFVDFAPGNFPDSYEAYEGQENLVFSQYVTVMNGGGLVTDGLFAPPVDTIPGVTIPTDLPPVLPDGGLPEDGEDDNDYENGGYYPNGGNDNANGNGYPDGGDNGASG